MLPLLLIPIILLIYMLYRRCEYHPMITGGGKKIHKSYFTKDKLKKYKDFLETLDNSYASLIIQNGKVIFKYGDVSSNKIYTASMRKGILGILYGMYDIDINKTLKELDIDDVEGLTDEEKTVTIKDLLQVRSGIYHPASNKGGPGCPPRGSKKRGEIFCYNNWDFNVLGTIFEQETGMNIHDAVKKLGDELGFEDYDKERVEKDKEERKRRSKDKSIHPPYMMYLSARDLSKVGLLMLNKGKYKGKQIVPQKWIKKLTTLVTPATETGKADTWGYGHLMWVYDTDPDNLLYGSYSFLGVGGQSMMIIPQLNTIVVIKRIKEVGPEYPKVVDHKMFSSILFSDLGMKGFIQEYIPKLSYIKKEDDLVRSFNNIGDYKLTLDSEVKIGSITKLFTAIAIFILQKQGKLNVEDLANDYLPIDIGQVTIKDLINHTSGLARDYGDHRGKGRDLDIVKECKNATDLLNKVILVLYEDSFKPINPIGKKEYSNLAYTLLGVILEKVTGMTWYEFVKKTIIIPLDMNHTGMGKTNIPSYDHDTLKPINETQFYEIYRGHSCGALYSTIRDLDTFAKNLYKLPFDIEEFITDASFFWNKEKIILMMGGHITGSASKLTVQYTNTTLKKIKHIGIVLINCSEILYGKWRTIPAFQ